jgi:hypothetical protein
MTDMAIGPIKECLEEGRLGISLHRPDVRTWYRPYFENNRISKKALFLALDFERLGVNFSPKCLWKSFFFFKISASYSRQFNIIGGFWKESVLCFDFDLGQDHVLISIW